MIVQMFTVGKFLTNCFVASCENTREAIIIDPGFDSRHEAEEVYRYIEKNSLTLEMILNTHGHPDHVCGNGALKKQFGVPILIHEYDSYLLGESGRKISESFGFENASPPADTWLHDSDTVRFGKIALTVVHTPGHSRGSVSFIGEKEVFSGDTLFAGSIGRTDFPEGSEHYMNCSLRKLAELSGDLVVYPGHGSATTIGKEKRFNPFLLQL